VIAIAPVRVPAAVGLNVTEIVQLDPPATLVPHVFVSAKSPEAVIELTASGTGLVFVSVTVCGELVCPRGSDEKLMLVVDNETTGTELTVTVTDVLAAEKLVSPV
jgi:hypothetical protein